MNDFSKREEMNHDASTSRSKNLENSNNIKTNTTTNSSGKGTTERRSTEQSPAVPINQYLFQDYIHLGDSVLITQLVEESFCVNYDGYKVNYVRFGNIHVNATMYLKSWNVYKDSFGLDVVSVQIASNPSNPISVGISGFVRLQNTNLRHKINEKTGQIEIVPLSSHHMKTPLAFPNSTAMVPKIPQSDIFWKMNVSSSIYAKYDVRSHPLVSGLVGKLNKNDIIQLLSLLAFKDKERSGYYVRVKIISRQNVPSTVCTVGWMMLYTMQRDGLEFKEINQNIMELITLHSTAEWPISTAQSGEGHLSTPTLTPIVQAQQSVVVDTAVKNNEKQIFTRVPITIVNKETTPQSGDIVTNEVNDATLAARTSFSNAVSSPPASLLYLKVVGTRNNYLFGGFDGSKVSDPLVNLHFDDIVQLLDMRAYRATVNTGYVAKVKVIYYHKNSLHVVGKIGWLQLISILPKQACLKVNEFTKILVGVVSTAQWPMETETKSSTIAVEQNKASDVNCDVNTTLQQKTELLNISNTDKSSITSAQQAPKAPNLTAKSEHNTFLHTKRQSSATINSKNISHTSPISPLTSGCTTDQTTEKIYMPDKKSPVNAPTEHPSSPSSPPPPPPPPTQPSFTTAADMNRIPAAQLNSVIGNAQVSSGSIKMKPMKDRQTLRKEFDILRQKTTPQPVNMEDSEIAAARTSFSNAVSSPPTSLLYFKVVETTFSCLYGGFDGSNFSDPLANLHISDIVQLLDMRVYRATVVKSACFVAKVEVMYCQQRHSLRVVGKIGWLQVFSILPKQKCVPVNEFTKELVDLVSTAQWPMETEKKSSGTKMMTLQQETELLLNISDAHCEPTITPSAKKAAKVPNLTVKSERSPVKETVTTDIPVAPLTNSSASDQTEKMYKAGKTAPVSTRISIDISDATAERPPPPPPLPPQAFTSSAADMNRNPTVQLSTVIGHAQVSSGNSYIVDGLYFSSGSSKMKPMEVKLKLSADWQTLRKEFDILHMMSEQAPNYFVRVFNFLDCNQITYATNDEVSEHTRRSLFGMVMQRGDTHNLKWYLNHNKMHLDQLHRLTYAVDVIKIVSALHRMNYAWMDIKPHNFVTVRNEHNLLRVLGIDLDLARELDSNLPTNYNQVTWEYASPELAFRHPRTGYIMSSTSERQVSTPEQYDIWSLGVTVLEVLDDGNSFCSRIGGDVPAIQSKLRSLTDETVARHIHARFVGNDLQTRAIRSFLLTALKVNPAERPRASELIEVIQGSKITGLTATNKLIRDGFQRQEENFSELREMLTKLQHSLSTFQFELTNSVKSIIQTLQTNATGSELAQHANELTNVSNGIGQLANAVDNAVNAQEVERIFKHQFQNLVTGFLTNALGEAQENMNRSVAAALQQQQSFILEQFKNFTAIQEAGAKCNEKQFADLRTEISAKLGSLHEDFQEVSCELSKLSATMHRLEENQNKTHLLLVKLYTSESQANAHSKQMLQSLFTTLNSAVEAIENISGNTSPAKLESIIASVCSQLTDSRLHRPVGDAEKTVAAVMKSIASGLIAQDKTDVEEMRAIANSISELRNDMQSLAAQNKAMHEDIRFVRQEFAKQSTMLHTILTGESRVPTLMVVLPKNSSSIRGSLKRLFTDVMHIHFVCPITLRFGLPYKLIIPKGWVTKVAPVIKMSLMILKVALMCVGLPIPVPIPNLPTEEFSKLLSTLETSLNANIEGDTSVMNVLNEIDYAMSDVAALNVHNAVHLRKLSVQQKRLSTLTKSSYAEVYTLLHKLETGSLANADWTPKCTGLVRVTSHCDGTTSWVLNDATVTDEFHAKGKESMQVI